MCPYLALQTDTRNVNLMVSTANSRTATVGFHNSNLRIFNLTVSNPNKLIVDVFLTRCRISMCQGLGPKKHDEISETDRNPTLFTFREHGTSTRENTIQ